MTTQLCKPPGPRHDAQGVPVAGKTYLVRVPYYGFYLYIYVYIYIYIYMYFLNKVGLFGYR